VVRNGWVGFVSIEAANVRDIEADRGLAGDVVNSVTEYTHGILWVLNQAGVDWIRPEPNGKVTHQFDVDTAWSVLGDRDGRVWVGTYGGTLFRYNGRGLAPCSLEGQTLPRTCSVLFQDRQHTVWVGTPDGLRQVDGTRVRAIPRPLNLPALDVRAMAEDRSGVLYVGLNGGGLLRGTNGQWAVFTEKDGLADDHVWSLCVDAQDTVWIGTFGSGLSCWRGDAFSNFPRHLGLPRFINCILEDDLGYLWLGSNQGIFRVLRDELTAYAAGNRESINVIRYTKTDGLGTTECSDSRQPTAWKARDGRLWFATVRGLSVVDPRHLPVNTNVAPVVIEEVLINEKSYRLGEPNQRSDMAVVRGRVTGAKTVEPMITMTEPPALIVVPPGNQRLEIHYAALCFTAPDKVRFRYRLEPLDPKWTEAGDRRVAYYQGLPPGDYRFQVVACNNDGFWNETGASVAVEILPLFWQTRWFETTLFGVAIAIVWWWVQTRIGRLTRERAQQQEFSRRLIASQELERKRIAAELHDSLGQNLLIIKNRAVLARDRPDDQPSRSDPLNEISEVASQSIEAVREISHNLRPYQLDRLGLTKAIRAVVLQVSKSSKITIHSELDPVDELFSPELEIHFYRIVQEGLNNIVKHSHARAARVLVERREADIRLTIDDDGRGFDYPAVTSDAPGRGGLGLTSLAERARILGGRLRIESSPGRGTRLLIEIPLPTFAHEK
jgi:signal transduction histidine kinase